MPETQIKNLKKIGLIPPAILFFVVAFLSYLCVAESNARYSVLNRTWGFDNILYYGTDVRLVFLAILLMLILPPVNLFFQRIIKSITERIALKRSVFLYLIVAGFSFILFYNMQVKYHLLGDFDLRIGEIMKRRFFFTEYLSMVWLHYVSNIFISRGLTPDWFFRIYSCVAGGFFVFIACLLAHEAGKTRIEKLVCFFSTVCSSMLLFFCGYVEIYSSPAVLLLLYIYAGFRYLHQRSVFISPLLTLLLAIAFHLINAAALPSLVVLYYWRNRNKFPIIQKQTNLKIGFFLGVAIICGLAILFQIGSSYIMPLKKALNSITFLSKEHTWEFINGILLSSGLNFFVCLYILAKVVVEKTKLLPVHYFLLSLSGALLLLVLICNLQRGSGDWDIMAFPAIALNLLSMLMCLFVLKNSGRYLVLILCSLNLLNATLWIHINHTQRAVTKIDDMFANDPYPYYNNPVGGRVQLAIWFKNKQLYATAKKIARAACNEPGTTDLRGCLIDAECLDRLGKRDEAVVIYEWMLSEKKQPVYEAYVFLLDYYARKEGSEEKVVFYLRNLYKSFLADTEAYRKSENYNPEVMSGLFYALYQIEMPFEKPEKLKQILELAQELKKNGKSK